MGFNCGAYIGAWTVFVIVYLNITVAAVEFSLLADLGIDSLPDKQKINISLEEYTSVITTYLQLKDDTFEEVPELRVYRLDNLRQQDTSKHPLKMVFPISISTEQVESASVRLLLPPQQNDSSTITVRLNQILGTRRRRFLQDKELYLSSRSPKWCDFDVTPAVHSWINGQRNLGLELVCLGCRNNLNPQQAAITAMIHTAQKRAKRSLENSVKRISDCSTRHRKGKKNKCCRHEMNVTFKDLPFPQLENIVEPKSYEAGFCQGLCPAQSNNFATNHSRIQGMMHQIKKNQVKVDNKKNTIPKTCCAPSKLADLQIVMVNKDNPMKLTVQTWEKMQVVECACS
ncbi:bone morphogenetic protein 5 [Sitophilus oryzae]|uniref:Bone morphogenetic protein 5 n=1 Tax=Sitophilus oryzae TaxID=7048 RepID=A0A6J2XAR7_SITOR|nr:bone morphogenetic protein 5 [Sitophilus oryzae]